MRFARTETYHDRDCRSCAGPNYGGFTGAARVYMALVNAELGLVL